MKREEQIRNAATEYATHLVDTDITDFHGKYEQKMDFVLPEYSAFLAGVEWADANPESPWISVEEDLPCNHQELMKNEYFTVRVFVYTVNKDIRTDSMVKESSGWKWVNAEFNYRYWMTMPELPKE